MSSFGQERGHKHLGRTAAFVHLVSLVCMLALGCIWLWQPTTEPFQCRATNLMYGLVYSFVASQLIMAHMSKEPFEPSLWAIGAMAAGAINSRLRLVDPLLLTASLDLVVLIGMMHYVFTVINQVCEYLDIYCLTIKKRAVQE